MIRKMLSFVIISIAITALIAIGLILSQPPAALPSGEGLDFSQTLAAAGQDAQPLKTVAMRGGFDLQVRRYPSGAADAPLLILVHGSGWHGMQFDALARALSTSANVIVPDLRGHGPHPGVRGDIAYIGQFEGDLADLIAAEAKPDQKIILGGHSSGGGLVVRFAGGEHGDLIDGAILLAPFLKYNAPTTRPNSGGWAHPLTPRIIGLSMVNAVGIRVLNGLTIMQLRMPEAVLNGPLGDTATTAYSYRLNTGFAPRAKYLDDVAALPRFLLIAGTADEAFDAPLYEPTMAAVTDKGRYQLVDGVGHLDIVNAPQTRSAVEAFLNEF